MLNSEEGDTTTFIANGEWALLGKEYGKTKTIENNRKYRETMRVIQIQ